MNTSLHLDTNALIALVDPLGSMVVQVRERAQAGILPEASAVVWHEFVKGPLLSDELLHIERVVGSRIRPMTRSTAELAARLFNATGRRRASTADCLIAASAIEHKAQFMTANLADFTLFEPFGLRLYRP
ncbi:MAG TPA: PIN domain-containing protein [Verrucomicrobiales bacterium]|nr:PIN domain-containing protein [Verrucomicrobiales bacterium]